ncbi:hypothetical protein [uncultured Pyramidobacter sp.]|uniref:hypothetical protein n=1 Tax=uncultured Pyramidobacter sp. TaxID=1623495 RepID=UPI002804D1F6|nr:hypothetical protein [uncultured Pyramidobacter sp.]
MRFITDTSKKLRLLKTHGVEKLRPARDHSEKHKGDGERQQNQEKGCGATEPFHDKDFLPTRILLLCNKRNGKDVLTHQRKQQYWDLSGRAKQSLSENLFKYNIPIKERKDITLWGEI